MHVDFQMVFLPPLSGLNGVIYFEASIWSK